MIKKNNKNKLDIQKGFEMYFVPEIAEKFAELEQNEKNYKVAEVVDTILQQELADIKKPIHSAELCGGAHPDRYHDFFNKLVQVGGHVDWVDMSPKMLELAEKYISDKKYEDRRKVISFIESDMLTYLRGLENKTLDVAVMKYAIDFSKNLDELFELFSLKLKDTGILVATIGSTNPELQSHSTNAQYLYNNEQIPENETRTLQDGDCYTIQFFKVAGDPHSGNLEGAKTVKYYHSVEKIKESAITHGFEIFIGDWKNFVAVENQKDTEIFQDVLVLKKK